MKRNGVGIPRMTVAATGRPDAPACRACATVGCRRANPKLCVRAVAQLGPGPLLLALPFPPARRIVPPPSAPAGHPPDRSSGRQSRNRAAPVREDALSQAWTCHSFSGEPESSSLLGRICGFFGPDRDQPPGVCTVPHLQEKSRPEIRTVAVQWRRNHPPKPRLKVCCVGGLTWPGC